MPSYQWKDRPLGFWLKDGVPALALEYSIWRKQHSPKFIFENAVYPQSPSWEKQNSIVEAERILAGEIRFFSHQYQLTDFPPNWIRDPISGVQISADVHWSKLSDENATDVKLIWEPNRFLFTYTLARAFAASEDDRYADAFWRSVESWAHANPPNTGPNWMDGQEAALRIMAWTFAFYAFSSSSASTVERTAQLVVMLAAHAERIFKNTDFAIFTRGNHSITEALALWMTGTLFPELKHAEAYRMFGRKSLEHEAQEQLFPDGSYAMYSLNYHRFVMHVYMLALRLAELNRSQFAGDVKDRFEKSIDYLSNLVDLETGQISFYGSNDGALVLPLNNCDFTDLRPLLQAASVFTKGRRMFPHGEWDEDIFWLCGEEALSAAVEPPKQDKNSFDFGGVYVVRGLKSKVLIRCTKFRERPSHADQLHADIWINGNQIACDAGTYLYSGQGIWRNALARTAAHNTVIVDGCDQMTMVSRFTWTNWASGRVLRHDEKLWQGEHDGYKPVRHVRTVLNLPRDRWLILDDLSSTVTHSYALHWLLNDVPCSQQENSIILEYPDAMYKVQIGMFHEGVEKMSIVRADPNSTRGWRSKYYASKEPAISMMLQTRQNSVRFWTYFGEAADRCTIQQGKFFLNGQEINLQAAF